MDIQFTTTPEELTRGYRASRFALTPRLITVKDAGSLLGSAQHIPARRVTCGIKDVSWDEQSFEPSHPAYQFFMQAELLGLVRAMTTQEELQQLTTWTSVYGLGEYINPHRDRGGSIQLLVCLQSPTSRRNGGELVLSGQSFFLTPGDAVFFEATTLEHYTTPLIANSDDPNPRRVVLVGRYFLSD